MSTIDNPSLNSSIPWSQRPSWIAAHQSILFHLNQQPEGLESLNQLAGEIEKLLKDLAPRMEMLCAHTCVHCPDPCCLTASVWYDFRDLLSLHLMQKPIPMGQPISDYRGLCRFITGNGCSLPREIRPWICTWYLCPVQTRWLKKRPAAVGRQLLNSLEEIKNRRVALEQKFIAVFG